MKAAAIVLLLFISFSFFSQGSEIEWWHHALRLTGESDRVRTNALQSLSQIPELNTVLASELRGERRFLALDVISALKIHALRKELLLLAVHDETGFFYSTINGLMQGEKPEALAAIYRERAMATATSPASRAVLLDTLARMGAPLLPAQIGQLLQDPSHDVQSAALGHLRWSVLKLHLMDYLPLLSGPFDQGSLQLRMQVLYILSELPANLRERCDAVLKSCRNDPDPEIRSLCLSLQSKRALEPKGGKG